MNKLAKLGAYAKTENAELMAIALIAKHEGFRSEPYVCPGGKLTIGYGFSDANVLENFKGKKMTRQDADYILGCRVRKELAWLNTKLPGLTPRQQVACVSFIYNLGRGNFLSSTMFKRLKEHNFAAAAIELKRWDHANGVVLAGLTVRRAEEAKYLLG